jgi:hypothetical protein
MTRLHVLFGSGLLIAATLTGSPALAQQPGGRGGQAPPPRNLQILQPQDVGPSMRAFTAALGVQCNYCHVMEPTRDMALDDKPAKKTARVMLQMVGHVNEMIAAGVDKPAADVTRVQCWTCHRGQAIPEAPPPPPARVAPGGAAAPPGH